jgi:hypothetical protein
MTAAALKRPPGFEALRMFLRKTEPAFVVAHTELGDRTIDTKTGQWRELADTIVALKPHGTIEAFNLKGLLLKTFDAERVSNREDDSMPLATSTHQSDMVLYQKLLAEAYRHSNEREAQRWETAFGQVVRLVEIAFRRLETIEASWAKMHRARAAELERAEEREAAEEPDLGTEVVGSLLQGLRQGAAEKLLNGVGGNAQAAPSKGKPNGKGS